MMSCSFIENMVYDLRFAYRHNKFENMIFLNFGSGLWEKLTYFFWSTWQCSSRLTYESAVKKHVNKLVVPGQNVLCSMFFCFWRTLFFLLCFKTIVFLTGRVLGLLNVQDGREKHSNV